MNRPSLSLVVAVTMALPGGCLSLSHGQQANPDPDLGKPADIEIPILDSPPPIEGTVSAQDWPSGAHVRGNFTFGPDQLDSGTYPFEITFGANESWLFFRASVHNVSLTHNLTHENKKEKWAPDMLQFFMAPHFEGNLTAPAESEAFSHAWDQGMFIDEGFWNGTSWLRRDDYARHEAVFQDFHAEANRSRFTLIWEGEVSRALRHPAQDTIDLGSGATFRLCLSFTRETVGFFGLSDPRSYPTDTFPRDGQVQSGPLHPNTWLKVRMPG